MTRPILVYLDTSDFANFAKCPREPRYEQVFNYLMPKVLNKEICVPFSFFHVVELIRDFDQKHFENRRLRAATVMEISQGKALRHPPVNVTDFLSDKGEWYPSLNLSSEFEPSALLKRIKKAVNEEGVARGVSRNKRRQLTQARNLKELIKKLPDGLNTDGLEKLILPSRLQKRNVFRDLLLGTMTAQEVGREIEEIFCNLTMLVSALAQLRHGEVGLSSFVTGMFQTYDDAISRARDALSKGQILLNEMSDAERSFIELGLPKDHQIIKELKEIRQKTRASLQISESSLAKLRELNELSPGQAERVTAYMRSNLYENRKMKESDVVDIFHSAYIPAVDLWRGDRWFTDMLRRANINDSSKVVGQINDLPSRIEALLNGAALTT